MSDKQDTLLDEYWTELKLYGSATPPQGLDGVLAQVATSIHKHAQLPEPSTAMMERLQRKLVHDIQAQANRREANARARSLAAFTQLVSGVRVGLLFQHAVVAVLFMFGVLCAGTPEAPQQTRLSVNFLMRTTSPGYEHMYSPLVLHLRPGAKGPAGPTVGIVKILDVGDRRSAVGNFDSTAGNWLVTSSTDLVSAAYDNTVRFWRGASAYSFPKENMARWGFRPFDAMITGRHTSYFERGTYDHLPMWGETSRSRVPRITAGNDNVAIVSLRPKLGNDSVESISVDLTNPRVTLFDLLQRDLTSLRLLPAGALDCGYALRP